MFKRGIPLCEGNPSFRRRLRYREPGNRRPQNRRNSRWSALQRPLVFAVIKKNRKLKINYEIKKTR